MAVSESRRNVPQPPKLFSIATSRCGRIDHILRAPCERSFGRACFGNGLLCGLTVRRWETIPLPSTQERGLRVMLLAETEFSGETLHVLITHIDRGSDHKQQLATLLADFMAVSEPAVLMGDLNGEAGDPSIAPFLKAPGVKDAVGSVMGASAPADRIDWIFTRGLQTISAGVDRNDASDHPMVWAELKPP